MHFIKFVASLIQKAWTAMTQVWQQPWYWTTFFRITLHYLLAWVVLVPLQNQWRLAFCTNGWLRWAVALFESLHASKWLRIFPFSVNQPDIGFLTSSKGELLKISSQFLIKANSPPSSSLTESNFRFSVSASSKLQKKAYWDALQSPAAVT